MAKPKQSPRQPLSPEAVARLRRGILVTLIAGATIGVLGFGTHVLRQSLERRLTAGASAPGVILKNRPAWMSDGLADQLCAVATTKPGASPLDHELLKDIADRLARSAWVKQVRQVRRGYNQSAGDTIEIDCEFRAPVALVNARGEYWLVDGEGVKLPERYAAAQVNRVIYDNNGQPVLRIIEGVAAMPPYQEGGKWTGDDLAAALDLARFLSDKPAAQEVEKIDVTNFKNRRKRTDPQIVLYTAHNAKVWWGEPVRMTFHAEFTPDQKLAVMEKIIQKFGRLDTPSAFWDVRMEKSASFAPVASGQP